MSTFFTKKSLFIYVSEFLLDALAETLTANIRLTLIATNGKIGWFSHGERGLAVRRLSVAQETEGSNPFAHPIHPTSFSLGRCSKVPLCDESLELLAWWFD